MAAQGTDRYRAAITSRRRLASGSPKAALVFAVLAVADAVDRLADVTEQARRGNERGAW